MLAATDFLSVEVLTLRGLVTYYILFFIHVETRKVVIAGITQHPNERWMQQMARNVTMVEWCFLQNSRYLIHDRDTKYTKSFQTILEAGQVKPVKLPARSPNLNAYAERWVRSVAQGEDRNRLVSIGLDPVTMSPEQFAAFIRDEIAKWSAVVRSSGARAE